MSATIKPNQSKLKQWIVTTILFLLIVTMVVAGSELLGIVELPSKVVHWAGAILLGYVAIGGLVVTFLCSQSLLKDKE